MSKNHLSSEVSPYLLQHKDNPVHWYSWGEEAFLAARKQDKPIFLSIGYSTCYWCHVMEKDSFETEEVASVLNEHFISIKIDREERPDVDAIYMDAVVGLTGHGGWPMSIFLTADLKPFWGGTFFPKDKFIEILLRINEVWKTEKEKVLQASEGISQSLTRILPKVDEPFNRYEVFRTAVQALSKSFDQSYGGFGNAPKFPPSQQIRFLLRYYELHKDAQALKMATDTLNAMAAGGIFDHIGCGFHRYSTDERWLAPHFEKMLYDNALLLPAYVEAFLVTGDENFRLVADQTAKYLLSMQSDEGGFYSAEDAGEVGKEGEFYIWEWKELERIYSSDDLLKLQEVFEISAEGNFEEKNIFALKRGKTWQDRLKVTHLIEKLFEERTKRVKPHLDDKILTSWNGLAISALARASVAMGDKTYIDAAVKAASFINSKLYSEKKLFHRYREGQAGITGLLEDYAYLLDGLVELYQATKDEKWLIWSKELVDSMNAELFDKDRSLYRISDAQELYQPKVEIIDGAMPSGNSVLITPLLFLGHRERVEELLTVYREPLGRYPTAFGRTLYAISFDACLGGVCLPN